MTSCSSVLDYAPTPFSGTSGADAPKLEYVFQIRIRFGAVQNIAGMPSGAGRGAVYIEEGTIAGPRLNGRVVEHSGADWALFRPDDTLATDARYMLRADDGTLILMHNRGYLWGREQDTLRRMQDWMFRDGPKVDDSEFYLRCSPTFEVQRGPHDWLTRHIIVGIGQRQIDGNTIHYYALL